MKILIVAVLMAVITGCSKVAVIEEYAVPVYSISDSDISKELFIGLYYKNDSNCSSDQECGFKPFRSAKKSEFERISTANTGRVLISMMPDNIKIVSKGKDEVASLNVYIHGKRPEGVITHTEYNDWDSFGGVLRGLTLGVFGVDYKLDAKFEITFVFKKRGSKETFSRTYKVGKDKAYKKLPYSNFNASVDASMDLFQKELRLKVAEFLGEYSANQTEKSKKLASKAKIKADKLAVEVIDVVEVAKITKVSKIEADAKLEAEKVEVTKINMSN